VRFEFGLSWAVRPRIPDYKRVPAKLAECTRVRSIPPLITLKLGDPVAGVSTGCVRPAAAMAMPKASMNLYDLSPPGEHKIRPSWQIHLVQPISVAHTMNETAYSHFGVRIAPLYPPHIFAAIHPLELSPNGLLVNPHSWKIARCGKSERNLINCCRELAVHPQTTNAAFRVEGSMSYHIIVTEPAC